MYECKVIWESEDGKLVKVEVCGKGQTHHITAKLNNQGIWETPDTITKENQSFIYTALAYLDW
jgi:hypothetical protein